MACLETRGVNRKKCFWWRKLGGALRSSYQKINGSSPRELASRRGRPPAAFGYLGMRWCLFFTFNLFTFPFNQLSPLLLSHLLVFFCVPSPFFYHLIIQPACKEGKDVTNCLIPWRDADRTIFPQQPQGYLLYTKHAIHNKIHVYFKLNANIPCKLTYCNTLGLGCTCTCN